MVAKERDQSEIVIFKSGLVNEIRLRCDQCNTEGESDEGSLPDKLFCVESVVIILPEQKEHYSGKAHKTSRLHKEGSKAAERARGHQVFCCPVIENDRNSRQNKYHAEQPIASVYEKQAKADY